MASTNEELDLLERVFLRIGTAETDEQLENVVNKFLIPVLGKLSSNQEGVRKKVMELLVHVNNRIKRRPAVQLPVEALLQQYANPQASSFLINFAILYIKVGFPRLPIEKQIELAPMLVAAVVSKPQQHQDSLLLLLMSVIGSLKVPTEPEKKKGFLGLDQHPSVPALLSSFMLDVLLMPYVWIPGRSEETPPPPAPPGMSPYGMARISSPEIPMTGELLEKTKRGILEIIMGGIFAAEESVVHLLVAAADTRFTVTDLADTELNRLVGTVDWSNLTMSTKLLLIYLGTPKQQRIPDSQRRQPANTRIRIKLLPYLSRLEKAAIHFPFSLQVVFDSLYGVNTNAKLKQLALNFALAIVRKADESLLRKMAPMMYMGMLKLVWSADTAESLKVTAYTAIGVIVKRQPSIINNLRELQVFFENLNSASPDVRSAVRDALISMVDAFKLAMEAPEPVKAADASATPMQVDTDTESPEKSTVKDIDKKIEDRNEFMTGLLGSQMEEPESMARFVASTYAATVFPPDHATSRYLLLLASGDPISSVSAVASRALYHPQGAHAQHSEAPEGAALVLPDFAAMVQCVYDKAKRRLSDHRQAVFVANFKYPFNLDVVDETLHYLRCCLAQSAGVKVTGKQLLAHPCESSPLIGAYLRELHQSDSSVVDKYLSLVDMMLSPSCLIAPLQTLAEVIGCCPDLYAARYAGKMTQFASYLSNSREEVRESAALIYGNMGVAQSSEQTTLSALLREAHNDASNLELQHGNVMAAGHVIERSITCGHPVHTWPEFQATLTAIDKMLTAEAVQQSAACESLSLFARLAALPVPDDVAPPALSKKGITDKLLSIVKSGKTGSKVRERAILACGYLCLGKEFPYARHILQSFLDYSKEIREIDIHFSIGEAVVLCVEGRSSVLVRDAWRIRPDAYDPPPVSEESLQLLNWFLDQLLAMGKEPHPNMRQAVCAYLLSVTKRLSHLPSIQNHRVHIQNVFMEFLSENNELVQDMASKGLAVVYENGTAEQQKTLVTALLDQLLAGKRSVQQVTGDTKIFEEGQLGAAPGGGNLSTYRELCSLASDLNQPDLVYKFMHLANHNAVWNSKKGAAFGFQTIASQANEQLNEYLPAVVPRLYRYQFDPTPRIQQSMANIWHSIVKDTNKTVDKYQHEILADLLANLTSNQWRVRSSCCSAVSDFFRGNRSVLDHKDKLAQLWDSMFRVMDDVHEGTRQQAQSTARTLANICVRVCDHERLTPDQQLVTLLLDIFLNAITSIVAEVRQLCLQTVSQLVTLAGAAIKPCLSKLIPALLEAAGELESVNLSYLSARFGGQAQAQDIIDSARASATKSHYTTQTVTKCVQFVDVEMLESLVPKILEIMKSVNLGSRVASAHLIILLAHHLGKSMEAYTGKFLAGLVNGLLDRNSAVRKTYGSTIGQILHTAKQSSVERLMVKINTWYFEKEDSVTRTALGNTLQAVAQYNSELLKQHFPLVIPLVFFAMNDLKTEENKSQVEMWEEVWNEISPGTEAGIRQHFPEITALMEKALSSPSWNMKAQAGRCITTAAARLDANMAAEQRGLLIGQLLTALQGRTFRGKEELVTALAALITHAPDAFRSESALCSDVVDALLREAGKSEPAYKRHSIQALGNVLDCCPSIDRFSQTYAIVQDMLTKLKKPETDEDAGIEELSKARNENFKTQAVLYETLGKAWPRAKTTQLQFETSVLAECLQTLERSPRDVQVSILTGLHSFLEKLHYWEEPSAENETKFRSILGKVSQALVFSLGIAKHTRLRKEALNIVWLLGRKLRDSCRTADLAALVTTLTPSVEALAEDNTPEVRIRLMDLNEFFTKGT